ncbi:MULTISPECIES: MCE family protein [Mycobacteriaceae]|uniref:MCE-family protein MCE1A n=1 Tax=Mycolicibacterium neoaurum VKM Ac-1815D TaxID=700508 RepID=V5X4I1_MYCNE|nr:MULTISPECIES: MCE family protein [Mycobacteriaceae]AHC23370.1 MCE-family protein MCE1A [Mycolicibacterium neoaurum VKM Ac-1815D]AMO04094.1 MCE-family protein MCE1A [Mycolicibacterium neoaurum]AXK77637.1 MCE family protein [Mycolicibacterium neoaurum]KJQ49883.1 MCE-family protein MCE1A [Mycolicibacterium neoaurum]KUM07672.1 MCE-family protein MCE1A [Mycolicibacterium neoaurum]
MTQPSAPLVKPKTPPYKVAGVVLLLVCALVLTLTWLQFRGYFEKRVQLTVMAERAGLAMDPGSKVTFNGVPIGRLAESGVVTVGDVPQAKLTLDVDPKYLSLIPANVQAELRATTVFGNKYISFLSPPDPSAQRLSGGDTVQATGTTTEFNTLFETIMKIAQQIDPVKLNQTLTAAAQALDGLGDKFGQSLVDGNDILGELNARMPQIRRDVTGLANLADVYSDAAPDLFDGLTNAVTTAQTLNAEQGNIDQALMAAVGFGNTGADIFERGGPYLVRGAEDLLPTSKLLDYHSPALFCTIRNYHDSAPKLADALGGNGYSLRTKSSVVGVGNPYVFPDNLPRVNATGGPGGRPGCWQPITRDLWPMPYLVMDTGASLAPYNHFELGQPIMQEYVWGRQVGENTINP